MTQRLAIEEADAVIEGGGIHVLALAGAIEEFGEHGVTKWVEVAGVGAGSIIASLLACGHDPRDVVELVRSTKWAGFVDCGRGGATLGGYWNFLRRGGVAHGRYLRDWMGHLLNMHVFGDVRYGEGNGNYRLALVAYDFTHRRLLRLPDDLAGYRFPGQRHAIDLDGLRIADGVRMAMSIVGLFPPIELVEVESGDRSWIVDAGPYSNFPVSLFDQALVRRPTLGFRVGRANSESATPGTEAPQELGWRGALGPDPFQTTPLNWNERDQTELSRMRACVVPVSGVEAGNFDLSEARQAMLLQAGRDAARAFLETFSYDSYLNTMGRRLSADP